jgi:hypothetical protein
MSSRVQIDLRNPPKPKITVGHNFQVKTGLDLPLSQVTKVGKVGKKKPFDTIREYVPKLQHYFVFRIDNVRGKYPKDVRQEHRDCR